MSDALSPTGLTPDDELAAEHALGVLTGAERAAADRRMRDDPAFAAEVAAWHHRLAPLLADIPSDTPPDVVWRRIHAQLGPLKAPTGLWNNIQAWRGATAASVAAAAAAVAFVLLTPAPTPVGPVIPQAQPMLASVAMLKPEAGPASFMVTYDARTRQLIIAPSADHSQAGKSYELWLLPKDGAPVSLGVLDGRNALTLHADALSDNQASLAVSLEPTGGSPGPGPTGPVVASGQLSPL